MAGLQWLLDLTVIVLLAATLFHAVRLERALGVLKRDRAALERLVEGFNTSTREAQAGIERLRAAADGAGRGIERQTAAALAVRDDLRFLAERGEQLAERLDQAVRAARGPLPEPAMLRPLPSEMAAALADAAGWEPPSRPPPPELAPGGSRTRSQAERDLLAALRQAR